MNNDTQQSVRIECWSCGFVTGNEYTPPEQRRLGLKGVWPDGRRRITTAIEQKLGPRLFRTKSGSLYALGDPDPEYLAWLKAEGKKWNPEDPIRFHVGEQDAEGQS